MIRKVLFCIIRWCPYFKNVKNGAYPVLRWSSSYFTLCSTDLLVWRPLCSWVPPPASWLQAPCGAAHLEIHNNKDNTIEWNLIYWMYLNEYQGSVHAPTIGQAYLILVHVFVHSMSKVPSGRSLLITFEKLNCGRNFNFRLIISRLKITAPKIGKNVKRCNHFVQHKCTLHIISHRNLWVWWYMFTRIVGNN